MIRISTYIICVLFLADSVNGQVIYERTYPDAVPSLKEAFQLTDLSTVSFANNSTCYFARWRHISPSGDVISEGGLSGESTHSFKARQIAPDSILVSCRVGPLDYPGSNYFQVLLWTPDTIAVLVRDTVFYSYWEDNAGDVSYDAFLIVDNHVLYQKEDQLFSKNILTGQVDFSETFSHITQVYPLLDGLMIFSDSLPPTYFNNQFEPIKTWLDIANHPISFNDMVAMDSFIVGINIEIPTALHAVNAFDENTQDIDLATYFSEIDSLVVRGDILIATGRNGVTRFALQLDKQFNIIHGAPFVVPEGDYPWVLSVYPEQIYAWRIDGFSGYNADYRVAYSYLNPQPIKYVDLSLMDISVDSVYLYSQDLGAPYILILEASIINLSEDTLHNLTLHYQEEPFQLCDPGVYPAHHKNLETAPGDTAIVNIWAIIWASEINKPFIRTFFVEHGNHHLDSNRTDNVFEFAELISKTDESETTSSIVFPNPFNDFLAVSDQTESSKLFLYDQAGQLVAKGITQLNDLSQLPSGIYFLQIQTDESSMVTRVIKVE